MAIRGGQQGVSPDRQTTLAELSTRASPLFTSSSSRGYGQFVSTAFHRRVSQRRHQHKHSVSHKTVSSEMQELPRAGLASRCGIGAPLDTLMFTRTAAGLGAIMPLVFEPCATVI